MPLPSVEQNSARAQVSVKLDSMQGLQPMFALPVFDYVSRKISDEVVRWEELKFHR